MRDVDAQKEVYYALYLDKSCTLECSAAFLFDAYHSILTRGGIVFSLAIIGLPSWPVATSNVDFLSAFSHLYCLGQCSSES
jgi:hypothetical protein